jgi:DNA-binding NarL/FixJ family response regulator
MPKRKVVNIVILDRRAFDRLALRALCEGHADFRVVATAADIDEGERILTNCQGEAIVLVGRLLIPDEGPEKVARLRSANPTARIILVGTGDEDRLRIEAVRVEADGFLRRDGDANDQLEAISGQSSAVPRWALSPVAPLSHGDRSGPGGGGGVADP